MTDRVLVVFNEADPAERDPGKTAVRLHIVKGEVRAAAMAMISIPMRRLVDSYAIHSARVAMACKYVVATRMQAPLDACRKVHRSTGSIWPLTRRIHPIVDATADDVYLMTALEFLPVESTDWIYATLLAGLDRHRS